VGKRILIVVDCILVCALFVVASCLWRHSESPGLSDFGSAVSANLSELQAPDLVSTWRRAAEGRWESPSQDELRKNCEEHARYSAALRGSAEMALSLMTKAVKQTAQARRLFFAAFGLLAVNCIVVVWQALSPRAVAQASQTQGSREHGT